MKKIVQLTTLFLLCFLIVGLNDADAQRSRNSRKRTSKNDQYFDESGSLKSRLWYGGGFNLGFSGGNNINVFNIGLSPMVGYKIIEPVSIGPRVGIQYSSIKGIGSDGRTYKLRPISYSVGIFSRFKAFQNLFAQVEYEFESTENFFTEGSVLGTVLAVRGGEVLKQRENRDNFYIGGGYNSGNGIFGYEIVLLFNLIDNGNNIELPIDLRFGFTWNF
ncbi:MAG: hypothetical protein AAFV25_01155 [Bacteroidota bacterium]